MNEIRRKSVYEQIQPVVTLLGMGLLLFFSYLMLQIILPYRTGRLDIAYARTKTSVIHLVHWRWAFYVHIATSMLVLVAGFTQFSHRIMYRYPKVHRLMGKLYVLDILFVTGPAAFVMSFYANGGWVAQVSFVLLSVLWWGVTYRAYRAIRAGNLVGHGEFMIRSYALTLSALTLRAWQFVFGLYWFVEPLTIYIVVAWLGWGLNLLVAEILIYHGIVEALFVPRKQHK